MALRFHLFAPNTLPGIPEPQFYPSPRSRISTSRIQCIRKETKITKMNDSEIANDLSREIAKINTLPVQKQEAMKNSREILFDELCRHLSMKEDEMKIAWMKSGEEERWLLIKGFVDEWSGDFHPLSAKSVKEMVEERLDDEKVAGSEASSSFPSGLIHRLKRFIGFE